MSLQSDVTDIKKILLRELPPEHFSAKDLVRAFFGALFLGMTFVFKGLLFQVSLGLQPLHLFLIVISTAIILTGEIYYIGYSRVSAAERAKRRFGQFWAKRFAAFYAVALLTSMFLVYIYGVNNFVQTGFDVFRIVVAVSLPCAIGAATADLLRKY